MNGIQLWKHAAPARFFDGMFGDLDRMLSVEPGSAHAANSRAAQPTMACDVREDEKAYYFTFDLPGFRQDDIKVEIDRDILSVKAERREVKEDEQQAARNCYRIRERRFGTFSRSFRIPEGLGADRVEAVYADGVLELTVPKPEEAKPVRVTIGSRTKERN